MALATVNGIEGLQELIGQTVGPSDWREVTQEMVDQFAELSGDDQWIHVDVERAKAGPFGAPIAHGFLTLFDVARGKVERDLEQWQGIHRWLDA